MLDFQTGRETKMTNMNFTSYFLNFDGFSIEARIDEQLSVNFTNWRDYHDPDFVFAVAEIWLNHKGLKHLIIPATNPGNFMVSLEFLRASFLKPPSVIGIEDVIPCGGWCSWMAGYFDRIDNESITLEDENLYDLLIHALSDSSRVGRVAVYMYGGKKIIEVAVTPGEGRKAIGVWSQINSDVQRIDIENMAKSIASNIRSAVKKLGSK